MPQLIAMIIVIVGALIYMFQTFGGTGDKIEGIAQKTSIVTEINNIKTGVKLAARSEHVSLATDGTQVTTLTTLAGMAYFAQQINEQLNSHADAHKGKYYALSFGGKVDDASPAMVVELVANREGKIPGIYIDLSKGSLKDGAGFLEAQIATDLAAIAYIDRNATSASAPTGSWKADGTETEKRTPAKNTGGSDTDGKFIIYFTDFGSNEVVVKK